MYERTRECVRVCLRERHTESERDSESESVQMIEYRVIYLRCFNKMLNLDKTTDFARLGERSISESAAYESGSSDIWKMSCMGGFQA